MDLFLLLQDKITKYFKLFYVDKVINIYHRSQFSRINILVIKKSYTCFFRKACICQNSVCTFFPVGVVFPSGKMIQFCSFLTIIFFLSYGFLVCMFSHNEECP